LYSLRVFVTLRLECFVGLFNEVCFCYVYFVTLLYLDSLMSACELAGDLDTNERRIHQQMTGGRFESSVPVVI
jgi:hypothetical protein